MFGKGEEPPAPLLYKMKTFFGCHWRGVLLFCTPLIALGIVAPFKGAAPWQWCAYCLVVMAVFWVTECIPLPITSFLPVVIFPLTGVQSTHAVCNSYANNTTALFLGSLMLACAVEQSGLHIRLALCTIRLIGYSHYKLLGAMCTVTTFCSMWLTNTAATTMMVPIIFALLEVFENQGLLKIFENTESGPQATRITVCYFCSATYSATIGGIGTLIGTGTNVSFKGLFEKDFPKAPDYISFLNFMLFGVPYMIILEIFCYLCMITMFFGFCRPKSKDALAIKLTPEAKAAAKQAVMKKTKELGPITFQEIAVCILFLTAILMFCFASPKFIPGWADLICNYFGIPLVPTFIKDNVVGIGAPFIMLIFPATLAIFKNCTAKTMEQLPKGRVQSCIHWPIMNASLPYSFCFLLGGGFALSDAAKVTNLNGQIGNVLTGLKVLPPYIVVLILIIFTTFVTNFASNVATAAVIVPIANTLATLIGANPLLFTLATGFSASYCFCLPVGTPGNLVVQSAAHVSTGKMIVAGAGPTVTTILITWAVLYSWAYVIWPDLKLTRAQAGW